MMQTAQATTTAPVISGTVESIERIGRIVAVTGGHAIILLDAADGKDQRSTSHCPEIGTLLKVDTVNSVTLALVSALSSPMPSHAQSDQELRIIEVEFIGELPKDEQGRPKSFRRGISTYPSLGNVVFRASKSELSKAYACDTDTAIRIGHIQQDASIPAMVKIDELLGKHFAVLGTTGTGKSCSVALILRRILEKNPQAHVVLLDVHREYEQSFNEWSEVISPENMTLPFWLLNFEEIVEILIGNQPNREADIEILRELIPIAKQRYMNNQRKDKAHVLRTRDQGDGTNVGIDTPVPYRASDLVALLDENIGKLDLRGELSPYKRLKARVETISRDPRYSFMFGNLTVQDTMAATLSRIFRIPVAGKPISILELGGLPSEIINVVVSVLARLAFDFGLWSGGQIPITFVCEEAHRYVPIDRTLGFEPTKRAISRIAKEGRKYGVSLCLVSQRPAELDPTILSQCSTIFSFRLSNERDQEILKAGISDAARSLLEFMSTMGAGDAITFGEGVALPTRVKFDMLPSHAWPKSNTASFTEGWARGAPSETFLQDVVARWRQQSFGSVSAETGEAAATPPQPEPVQRPTAPQRQPAAASTYAASGPLPGQGQAGDFQGIGSRLRRTLPPLAPGEAPLAPAPAKPDAAGAQPSLSSLMKQFRA
ncbi:ATP-binding protein [Taklimakanibacter lacteus]|uniref:ATP-binding protein n=1 Tax=Taklimakanibacter lacteus TaxID=2268456 RepID=UPI0034D6AA9E